MGSMANLCIAGARALSYLARVGNDRTGLGQGAGGEPD